MGRASRSLIGYVFACTNSTQDECFRRRLFGNNKVRGAIAIRVRKGSFLFLQNLDTDVLFGVFRAATDCIFDWQKDAWKGRYPYQVKVEPLGEITPLTEAEKLLRKLKGDRNSQLPEESTSILLELYGFEDVRDKHLLEYFSDEDLIIREPTCWNLPKKLRINDSKVERLPKLQPTTLWDFPRQSYGFTPKGHNKYAGVTPAELIWNLVWRYTNPGDLVVDPMCGSGTTIDVCQEEGRRAIGYDLEPILGRSDIKRNDARKIPLEDNTADMIFVDSPYGDNIRYNDNPACIGNISSEDELFYDELEKVIAECRRILKDGKIVGWLIGDQWVRRRFTPVGFILYQRLCKYFETVDIVCVPRRGQSSHTDLWTNRAKRFNFFLRGYRYLFIMRKLSGLKSKKINTRKVNWTCYER
jgi:DNA modification methylase